MPALNLFQYDFHPQTFAKRALQGAAIGLALMVLFMYGDNALGNKDWFFTFREYFPMITIAVGGACGGIFFSLMEPLRNQGGRYKVLANILCVVVFMFALWLSAVAGLAITGDWN
ncbi:MAG TPA: hypothetical protein VEY71_12980 [Chitinophagales bacterium]|nr:hypothetical protein [Chitinophagales bacterium]